jgi:FMN phosphatase YigB (HAD superfamily)
MHLFLDFDDTLVSGMNTWALVKVLPSLIEEHELPYDEVRYREGLLAALESASQNLDESHILDELFKHLGWPDELKMTLMSRVFGQFAPETFEDTLSFLDRMKAAGHQLYIAQQILETLGLRHYFEAVFTPKSAQVKRGKPAGDMWEYLAQQLEQWDVNEAYFVGDDPFSDGAFADLRGIPCYIIDRTGLYSALYPNKKYRWVRSLGEIDL